MALQGTIDTFPLADVLQLLSASSKTGRLLLEGDRGQMALWIDGGDVIGGEAATAPGDQAELFLFEMLRFRDGEFAFDSDIAGSPPVEVVPVPLDVSLRRGLELLESWAAIEAVVPSPAHMVVMAPELPGASIEIDQASWRVLTASGATVAQIAETLGRDEFSTTSAIAEMVEAGLLAIGEPATSPPASDSDRTADAADDAEEAEVTLDLDAEAATAEHDASFPDRFPIDDLIGSDRAEEDPWSSPEMEQLEAQRFAAAQSFDTVEVEPIPLLDPADRAAEEFDGSDNELPLAPEVHEDRHAQNGSVETADEVLRQMSKLSPKAAEAIAAALSSVPSGAGEPAEAGRDDDGPVSFSGTF